MRLARAVRGAAGLAAAVGRHLLALGAQNEKAREEAQAKAREQFKTFLGGDPHNAQAQAIASPARFLFGAAGLQGGKTSSFCYIFWQRILRDGRPGREFWMVAPDSIVGATMRERFVEMAPPGAIVHPKESSAHTRVWTLANGARVKFRSGENPKKLVAATLNGIWIDEVTLCKEGVWGKRLRGRLAATGGWAIFSGSPEGRNWAYEELWRPTIPGDDLFNPEYAGFLWKTADNPIVQAHEIEALRKVTPPSMFRRMYEASWEAFFGQVYESWNPERHVFRPGMLGAMPGEAFGGLDWGFGNPGAAVVCRRRRDALIEVVEEIHEAHRPPSWWHEKVKALSQRHQVKRWWCDPSDPGRIADMRKEGGVNALASDNEVKRGIKIVSMLFGADEIRIASICLNLIRELSGYQWDTDQKGRPIEVPIKENDHACFPGSTPITTPIGLVPIADLARLSFARSNGSTSPRPAPCSVVALDPTTGRPIIAEGFAVATVPSAPLLRLSWDGGFLETTADHPILTADGWRPARDTFGADIRTLPADDLAPAALRPVDPLDSFDISGDLARGMLAERMAALRPRRVLAIEERPAEAVYNILVPGFGHFFAGGVCVSNCDALRYAIMGERGASGATGISAKTISVGASANSGRRP